MYINLNIIFPGVEIEPMHMLTLLFEVDILRFFVV